ncbi:MAG: hypothetical protein IJR95_04510 [Lachnospiraceae bacterium]|nr:hypothetical protein [Lachnospiraceae bacterium]
MKDIAPELLEKIKKSFEERMKQNGAIKKLETRLKAGEGGFEEAEEYAGEVGRALSAAFGEHLSSDVLPDGRMYFNIADRVVTPLMEEEYRLATEAGMQAVRVANERAGIHLQGREPAFEPERVKGIVDRLASEESFDAVKWILGDPVESYAVHCVDETVKQNAEFLHMAGRTARIRRDSASRCCDWCAALDGVYEYPGVPREIYARHNNCTCTVEYLPGDGKAQDVWSKNSRDVSTREERRIFSERAISNEEAEERIRRAEIIKKALQGQGISAKMKTTRSAAKRIPDRVERSRVINEAIRADKPIFAEELRVACRNVVSRDGFVDVCLHGTQFYTEYEHKYILDNETLSYIISGRRDCAGQDIRLISCDTGIVDRNGNCVAQELADRLRVNVRAPRGVAIIGENGSLTVKIGRRKVNEEEGFVEFKPRP